MDSMANSTFQQVLWFCETQSKQKGCLLHGGRLLSSPEILSDPVSGQNHSKLSVDHMWILKMFTFWSVRPAVHTHVIFCKDTFQIYFCIILNIWMQCTVCFETFLIFIVVIHNMKNRSSQHWQNISATDSIHVRCWQCGFRWRGGHSGDKGRKHGHWRNQLIAESTYSMTKFLKQQLSTTESIQIKKTHSRESEAQLPTKKKFKTFVLEMEWALEIL
jgi:hypothetical protein